MLDVGIIVRKSSRSLDRGSLYLYLELLHRRIPGLANVSTHSYQCIHVEATPYVDFYLKK